MTDEISRAQGPLASRPTPPRGVLPGELSTVLGGVPDRWSITATVVDLARRGYLGLREVRAAGTSGRATDWELEVVRGDGGDLSGFERQLLHRLTARGGTAHGSDLGGALGLRAAQRSITQDTVDKG